MMPALLSLSSKLATLISRLTATRASNLDNLDAAISTRSTLTSAQAASAVWGAATRTLTSVSVTSIPSIVDSIQRVSGSLTTQTTDITINAVVVARTFVVYAGGSGPYGGAADFLPVATLINSTTLRISRGYTTGGSATLYSFFVVELK